MGVCKARGPAIPAGSPATILLAFGSDVSQPITMQATDFPITDPLPIDIVLTPEIGGRTVIETSIDLSSGELVKFVDFPINVLTHVNVWTRSAP